VEAHKGGGGCSFMAAPQKAGAAFRAGLLAAPRDVEELVSHPPGGLNIQLLSSHVLAVNSSECCTSGGLGAWAAGGKEEW
jgi:hypothetical protein